MDFKENRRAQVMRAIGDLKEALHEMDYAAAAQTVPTQKEHLHNAGAILQEKVLFPIVELLK